MELTQIKGNTWCLEGEELIPLYRVDETRCILLDSGLETEREDLRAVLTREGLRPLGVIGSHNHGDHVGNHRWLRETYGARICMSAGEAAVASSPAMCKLMLPGMSFRTLLKEGSCMIYETDRIIAPEEETVEFMGVPFRIHHTPGHTADHICIGTPDGVCYLGDALIAGRLLERAQLPYYDIHVLARESMEKIRELEGYSHFVAAHRKVFEDPGPEVDQNLALLDRVCGEILKLMETPVTWEGLMREVVERNHLYTSHERRLMSFEHCTQAYVDYLKDCGQVTVRVKRGSRLFQRA